jgi:hypothetical protein
MVASKNQVFSLMQSKTLKGLPGLSAVLFGVVQRPGLSQSKERLGTGPLRRDKLAKVSNPRFRFAATAGFWANWP